MAVTLGKKLVRGDFKYNSKPVIISYMYNTYVHCKNMLNSLILEILLKSLGEKESFAIALLKKANPMSTNHLHLYVTFIIHVLFVYFIGNIP